eukprot:Awhi_evm1s9546
MERVVKKTEETKLSDGDLDAKMKAMEERLNKLRQLNKIISDSPEKVKSPSIGSPANGNKSSSSTNSNNSKLRVDFQKTMARRSSSSSSSSSRRKSSSKKSISRGNSESSSSSSRRRPSDHSKNSSHLDRKSRQVDRKKSVDAFVQPQVIHRNSANTIRNSLRLKIQESLG